LRLGICLLMHFLYKDVESLLDRGRQLGVLLDMSWNEVVSGESEPAGTTP